MKIQDLSYMRSLAKESLKKENNLNLFWEKTIQRSVLEKKKRLYDYQAEKFVPNSVHTKDPVFCKCLLIELKSIIARLKVNDEVTFPRYAEEIVDGDKVYWIFRTEKLDTNAMELESMQLTVSLSDFNLAFDNNALGVPKTQLRSSTARPEKYFPKIVRTHLATDCIPADHKPGFLKSFKEYCSTKIFFEKSEALHLEKGQWQLLKALPVTPMTESMIPPADEGYITPYIQPNNAASSEIAALKFVIKEKDLTIQERDELIKAKDKQIKSLKRDLDDKDYLIEKLQNQLRNNTNQIMPPLVSQNVADSRILLRSDHQAAIHGLFLSPCGRRYNESFCFFIIRLLSRGLTYSSIKHAVEAIKTLMIGVDANLLIENVRLSKSSLSEYMLVLSVMTKIHVARQLSDCTDLQSGSDETPCRAGLPTLVTYFRDLDTGKNMILGLRTMAKKRASDKVNIKHL